MIRLRIEPTPVERMAAFLAVAGFAEEDVPLRGLAGRLDWRMGGEASRLILEGRLSGEWPSQALLASRGRLAPRYVLFAGLGKCRKVGAAALSERVSELMARVLRISVRSIAFPFSFPGADDADFAGTSMQMLSGILHGLDDHMCDVDLAVCEPDPQRRQVLVRVAEEVAFRPRQGFGLSAVINL